MNRLLGSKQRCFELSIERSVKAATSFPVDLIGSHKVLSPRFCHSVHRLALHCRAAETSAIQSPVLKNLQRGYQRGQDFCAGCNIFLSVNRRL